MTRFLITSLLAAVAFFAIGLSLHGWTRIWAFTAFWTVYLTIVGCGVSFIRLKFFGPVICRGQVGRMRVALTFDDGPDPAVTPALLDLFAREKIHATFFCIGKNVAAHPALAARIAAEGHLIGNHTFNHAWSTAFLGKRGLTDEIEKTQKEIAIATGITPVFMRPPVGLTNPHYNRVLKRLGLQMVGWDVRSMDTRWPANDVVKRVLKNTRDGSIILLHDGGRPPENVLEIVSKIVHGLRAKGFEFESLNGPNPTQPDKTRHFFN